MNPIESCYVKNENVSIEFFDKEAVLLNVFKGHYYSFKGEIAYHIWNLLSLQQSVGCIALTLQTAGVQGNTIDLVDSFIQQLLQEEIIVAVAALEENSNKNLPTITLTDTSLLPHLEVHTDLQELILLDPVHDVSSTKGWPYNN